MQFACNCGQMLSLDLYPRKRFVVDTTRPNDNYSEQIVKQGSFIHRSPNTISWYLDSRYSRYDLNKKDLILSNVRLQEYRTGSGCCDVDSGTVHCNSCNILIGYEFSDCWQTHRVTLNGNLIKRVFK
jgi:hypothetical protein